MPSSHRVGRRRSVDGDDATVSESEILRSLFELRKQCNKQSFPSSSPTVTEITFWNCRWSRRIINSLLKLIVRDGHRFSSFKFFDCEVNSPNFAEVISIVLSCNTTTKLIIKARRLVGSMNESNRLQTPHCQSTLAHSTFEKDVLEAIQDGILANTSLKFLQISGMNFTNKTTPTSRDSIVVNSDNVCKNLDTTFWYQILIKNNKLTHLDLSGSNLSTSTVSGLSSALILNTTLKSLNFDRCYLDDQSLAEILESVKNHPSLMQLNLSRNFLAKGTSTMAVHAIAEMLRSKLSKLQCLDLSYQQQPRPITIETDFYNSTKEGLRVEERYRHAFKDAFDALSLNTTLQRIDLSGNTGCFSELDSVEALTSCLVTNTGLSYVDISACDLAPVGFEHLAENCVPRCGRKLKSLVLFDGESNNSLVTKYENWSTISSLLEKALQYNSNLESLGDFGDEVVDSKSISNLQYLLNLNRAGRRAFRIDDLPLGAWPSILARASCIEYDTYEKEMRSSDLNNSIEKSLSRVMPASVLFEFLHGPAILIDSEPRKWR